MFGEVKTDTFNHDTSVDCKKHDCDDYCQGVCQFNYQSIKFLY